jgi:hypothetical protein
VQPVPAVWGLALLVAVALAVSFATPAHAATFTPELVISDAAMRDYNSMSEAEIQAFLEARPGILDTLVTTDHAGVRKRASRIIWEACQRWTISPKVMLTMLQKEQSLLTRKRLSKNTLSRAIGAGCPDGHTNRYPGFGNQMWWGAYCLDGYGEGRNRPGIKIYRLGMEYWVYGKKGAHVHPKNLATYKLYVYNPSIGARKPYGNLSRQACSGNANFWRIYRAYFGDPLAGRNPNWVVYPSATANGSVTPSARQTVTHGSDSATFTISPGIGYHIKNVSIDGVSAGAVATHRFAGVKGPHRINATFAINTYTIVPIASANGTITPGATQTVDFGGSRTFTVVPNAGNRIADVVVDGVSAGALTQYTFANVSVDHTISAIFVSENPLIAALDAIVRPMRSSRAVPR